MSRLQTNSVFSRPIIPLKATHFVGISGFEPHLLHITVVRIQCDGAHHLQSWGPHPLTNIQHLAPSSLSTPIELIWLFIFPPFWSTYIYHWFQSCLGEGQKCTVCKENWNIHDIYIDIYIIDRFIPGTYAMSCIYIYIPSMVCFVWHICCIINQIMYVLYITYYIEHMVYCAII